MNQKNKRSHRLYIRLSESEYQLIQSKAQQSGINISEFVRRAAFRREIPQPLPPINLDAYRQLGQIKLELYRMGINLNQITKDCHSSVQLGNPAIINPEEIELYQQNLHQINATLTKIASVVTNLPFDEATTQSQE